MTAFPDVKSLRTEPEPEDVRSPDLDDFGIDTYGITELSQRTGLKSDPIFVIEPFTTFLWSF